ncbi:MAG: alpha-xylosidase, partial [Streptomyces sp.]|nr:alpha-xylosidase [Streptomyces sp.]
ARTAHTEGTPVMRAMVLEFPDDPGCAHLERQYMLGPDLLVAPVFSDDGEVAYYVPEGTWTHLVGGETVTGPRWVREKHAFQSVPLLVRPGAVIPVGAVAERPDYDHADGVTLHAYRLRRGDRVMVRVGEVAFTVVREGDTLRASCSDPSAPWGLAAGERTVRAQAGTGFLSLELG